MTSTRRTFLQVVGAGAVASTLPACTPGATGPVAVGNVSALAAGDIVKHEDAEVLLARDDDGVYAMTASCAHLGCNIAAAGGVIGDDGTITCGAPCGHGSKYDANGAVLGGPTLRPLVHWKVTIDDDGEITVERGVEVPATDRVALA